jgi:hypothetical protein
MKNLKESEVCQSGGFSLHEKTPVFLPLELRGFFRQIFVDFRVLSNSASNFLINQTRNPDPALFGGGLKQPLCRARNRNVGGWGISQQAANWLTPRDTDLLKYPCLLSKNSSRSVLSVPPTRPNTRALCGQIIYLRHHTLPHAYRTVQL